MPSARRPRRELAVPRMLSSGYRNRVIAQKLVLSELTVKSHMWRIHPRGWARKGR
ncbi:LuxR C-terminal-related transcriptional regulator [Cupriavidus necator]|uniref:LuxR C-terminal-related transcriptional regulator n=1 Tax=Cupriavidus necator TaxID=106590 RepID=UPI0039C0D2FF